MGHLGGSCSVTAVNANYASTDPALLGVAETVRGADVKVDRAKKKPRWLGHKLQS